MGTRRPCLFSYTSASLSAVLIFYPNIVSLDCQDTRVKYRDNGRKSAIASRLFIRLFPFAFGKLFGCSLISVFSSKWHFGTWRSFSFSVLWWSRYASHQSKAHLPMGEFIIFSRAQPTMNHLYPLVFSIQTVLRIAIALSS